MEPQQIKILIDAMAASDLAEMEYSQEGWTLRLVRRSPASPPPASARPPAIASARGAPDPARGENASAEAASCTELRAPLYGVVHLLPAPGEPPFVVAGQAVTAGQTVCVIEAMKVFNEVRAEHDATVDAVLVTTGQEVEAGQALVRFV